MYKDAISCNYKLYMVQLATSVKRYTVRRKTNE